MLEERVLKLLDAEQLSSSKFADVIGVQRSSISHLLSGRNKPSFDFIQKTLKAFPHLSADWLILGEGKMYESETVQVSGSLFDQAVTPALASDSEVVKSPMKEEHIAVSSASESPEKEITSSVPVKNESEQEIKSSQDDSKHRTIKRVVLLYSDHTFESFEYGN